MHIHPPQPRHQIHRNKHSPQRSQLRKHIINLIIRIRHLNRYLRQVVRMRSRQDLLVVIQVLGHGYQVILDIGEIEALFFCFFW